MKCIFIIFYLKFDKLFLKNFYTNFETVNCVNNLWINNFIKKFKVAKYTLDHLK